MECSLQIQNDLIFCCAEAPLQKILQEIGEDNVKHCLKRKQMPAILANVDTGAEIQETPRMFMLCDTGMIGNRICRYILLIGVT